MPKKHKINPSKKWLISLSAVLVLAAVSFGLSQSNLLKGELPSKKPEQEDTIIDWNRPNNTTSSETESIRVKISSEDGTPMAGLTEENFSSTAAYNIESVTEATSANYQIVYTDNSSELLSSPLLFTVKKDGYVTTSFSEAGPVNVPYSNKVIVKDRHGNTIETASVLAGIGFQRTCSYSSAEEAYFCAIPLEDTGTSFSVYEENYIAQAGSFENDRNNHADPQETASIELGVCEALNINPDEYLLTGEANQTINFTLEVSLRGENRNEVVRVVRNGNGHFIDENGQKRTSLEINVDEITDSIDLTYENAQTSDTINAILIGEGESCRDNLILTREITLPSNDEDNGESNGDGQDNSNGDNSNNDDNSSDDQNGDSNDDDSDNDIIGSPNYQCTDPFVDTEDHWAENIICRMYRVGIVDGRTSRHFEPNDYVTRAEWIKVITLNAGNDESDSNGLRESFADVDVSKWYYPYIVIAESLNVIRPIENVYLRPNDYITRADAALLAVRLAGEELWGWSENDIAFSDISISDYYTYAVIIANQTQVNVPGQGLTPIIEGYRDGTFQANEYITRAEAMALLQRVYLAWYAN